MQIGFNPAIKNSRSLIQNSKTSFTINNALKADTVSFGAKRTNNNSSARRVKTAVDYS